MARLKLLRVSPEFMVMCCTASDCIRHVVENGLPSDAKVRGFYADYDLKCLVVIVASETFPEVPHGEPLEFLPETRFVDTSAQPTANEIAALKQFLSPASPSKN